MTGTLFFVGDHHFNHSRILEFEPIHRPFSNIREHDEALIERHNSVVKTEDVVWFLGDVFFHASPGYIDSIMTRLNGEKRLVMGNHDTPKRMDYNKYFSVVVGFWALKHKIAMTHYPLHPAQKHRFKANIHGHLHSHNVKKIDEYKNEIEDPWYINVSVEQINLTPISYEELKKKHGI